MSEIVVLGDNMIAPSIFGEIGDYFVHSHENSSTSFAKN